MKIIYFGIGLICLLEGWGCQPAKDTKPQLSKDISVYNREVREKHLERTLDSALWCVYTSRLNQYSEVNYRDPLNMEKKVFIFFYECALDTTRRIEITRDEKQKCNVVSMVFKHVYLERCHLNDLYSLLYERCGWTTTRFCPVATINIYDNSLTDDVGMFECMPGYGHSEHRVCEYFESPKVVSRMTPWLRREGVRRGYLSTDNW